MRKLFVVAMIVAAFCAMAVAQDLPKAEVFGGYSYFRADINELKKNAGINESGLNLNGWNAAATGWVSKNFGITADFSGHYGSPSISVAGDGSTDVKSRVHNFLFGPTVAYRSEKATLFGHALFGGTKATFKVPGSFVDSSTEFKIIDKTAFAFALGGGFDYNVHKNFAIRVGQFDWINTKIDTTPEFQAITGLGKAQDRQNNLRFSSGIVLKF